jgi:hypothetical protein
MNTPLMQIIFDLVNLNIKLRQHSAITQFRRESKCRLSVIVRGSLSTNLKEIGFPEPVQERMGLPSPDLGVSGVT